MIDLSTNIKTHALTSCLMNASGAKCMSEEELKGLVNSHTGAVVTKSCSIAPREGNTKPRYYHDVELSINSMGLPNQGYHFYLEQSCQLSKIKPMIMSISTLDLAQTQTMLEGVYEINNVSAIELNISCPNICGSDKILAYHFEDINKCLQFLAPTFAKKGNVALGIKLPPYWEPYQFIKIAELIIKYDFDFVTLVNSVPNCLVIDTDTESPVIYPKGGIGGLGGKFIKPVVLSNIYQLRRLLPSSIQIIGCGGIVTGEDVFHHLLCGASAVQIGTTLMQEGYDTFRRIESELISIMKSKNYTKVSDIVGKLKTHPGNLVPGDIDY
jgi:dihydroorotate dehydrogenase (fumarate)